MVVAACESTNPVTGGGGSGSGNGNGQCTGSTTCSGEVNRFSYNPTTDVVTINNLPFDLGGTYARDASFDTNGFRGYRNTAGAEAYVALFSADLADKVSAGVVGTDGYIDFGYGGTMYSSSGASLPQRGEAEFQGNYAGLRVTEGNTTAIGTSSGTAYLRMDFDDFDVVGAIDVTIFNRQAFDNTGAALGALPDLAGQTTDHNGIVINSTVVTEVLAGGALGESGTLEGIFGGTVGSGLGGQIAGVVVITSANGPGGENVLERGAFIADQISYSTP
jgi:hypothetical protein